MPPSQASSVPGNLPEGFFVYQAIIEHQLCVRQSGELGMEQRTRQMPALLSQSLQSAGETEKRKGAHKAAQDL